MNVTLIMITDGRRACFDRTYDSVTKHLGANITFVRVVDDSCDPAYAAWLDDQFSAFPDDIVQIAHHPEKRGFCGAVQTAWRNLPDANPYVFHLEDDFLFNRQVPIENMAAVLKAHPEVAQLCLRRQPWSPEEKAAGGIVEMWPDQYADREDEHGQWLEHRLFFSTNPSLYRHELTERGWPDGPACEAGFTRQLLEDPATRFAFWGPRTDSPWVEHIGLERVGGGY